MMEIDSRLLGSWRCLGSPGEIDGEAFALLVGRARERMYALSLLEKDKDPYRMEAYLSSVSGVTLLNVLVDPTDTKPWSFARYSFPEPDILHVQILDDTLLDKFDLSTPATLRAKVAELSQDPRLYMDFMVCVRVVPRP